MPRKTGEKKDRISLVISLVLHLIIVGAVGYWAWKSGVAEKIARRVLQFVRDEQKKETKQEPSQAKQAPPPKLPPINQGMPPPPSSGTRRAVAADAPASAGETFFEDTRRQAQGAGAGTSGPTQRVEVLKIIAPPPPPRPTLQAAPPSTIKAALQARAEATASIESFSSEQISKSGAGDVGEVIGKVAGATVVDGKFAVIRGLPDRYSTASLNGSEIPSADPYRKSVQLDLFPSAMIDRVVVSKTFTPDQPGGFSGGAIDIITKSFPERFHFSISGGAGYNEQATFNERFLTYDGGSKDWLGMDDGTRKEPKKVAGIQNIADLDNSWRIADLGNDRALREAQKYVALQRSFESRQLGPEQDEASFNRNFSISMGDVGYLFGRRLGAFGALSYDRKFSFYDEGSQTRYFWPVLGPGDREPGTPNQRQNLNDTRAIDEVSWAGTMSIAYELLPDHQLGFTYLFSQNGEDQARLRVGPYGIDNIQNDDISYLNELHWTERNLNTYQFYGRHLFPDLGGLGMNWLYSLAKTSQDEPDYRLFNYAQDTPGGTIIVQGGAGAPEPSGGPTRYFRNLEEDTSTFKLDFSLPFRVWQYLGGEAKFGGYYSSTDRDFIERTYTFKPATFNFSGDALEFANKFLNNEQLGVITNRNSRGGVTGYSANTDFSDELGNSFMIGHQEIQALYGMGTLPITEKLRLIGGARFETTEMQADSFSRLTGEGHGFIDEADLLPAAGLIYSPRKDMNIRFNFAQTIARPTFREFSFLRSYDVTGGEILKGNPDLIMSHIDNYDLRWEWFPRPGELLSASMFYKDIEAPLERFAEDGFASDVVTFTNFPFAKVYGIEFEARKSLGFLDSLLEEFSVGLNYSLIESESENVERILVTKRQTGFDDKKRPLFDQSPYIATVDLTYDNPRWGTTITLAYSEFGERLYLVNNAGADVYEQPAPQLDLIFSQRIGRHWKFRFSAKNLLDPWFERRYGQRGELDNEDDLLPYSSYRRGRTYTVSLGFDY